MTRATSKPVQLCCIRIGHRDYLMPSEKGLKVMELLQHGVECDRIYEDRGYAYTPCDPVEVELTLVQPRQVRARQRSSAEPESPQQSLLPAPLKRIR